jgi:hypothetical protein
MDITIVELKSTRKFELSELTCTKVQLHDSVSGAKTALDLVSAVLVFCRGYCPQQ